MLMCNDSEDKPIAAPIKKKTAKPYDDHVKFQEDELNLDTRSIYLTGEIEEDMVVDLRREMIRTAEYINRHAVSASDRYMVLFINCDGGCVTSAMGLIDTIEIIRGSLGVKVVGIVTGAAYSMATSVFQVCAPRLISKHSRFMVHQINFESFAGTADDLKQQVQEVTAIQDMVASTFAENNTAGFTKNSDWYPYLTGPDNYFNPEETIGLGMADAIFDPNKPILEYAKSAK